MSDSNRFPLYVVSKGRHEFMLTSRYLTEMNVHHFIVVEPQELSWYEAAVAKFKINATILELDMSYRTKFDLCDDLGFTKPVGSSPPRNFAWDHSIANGHEWHWVIDDNIRGFYRFNRNMQVIARTPAYWRAMEDFVLRYVNVAMAGPDYHGFQDKRHDSPPFRINTRIFSCNLIRNDVPFRWRGRYNEDLILSLDMLKAGWCTILFKAFLQAKMGTQMLKGGNTDLYWCEDAPKGKQRYSRTGTTAKSEMVVKLHPDVARMAIRWGRVHHVVDYSRFKNQKLIRKKDVSIPTGVNEFGMSFKQDPSRKKRSTLLQS